MELLAVEPVHIRSQGGHTTLATFDLQLMDGVRVNSLSLVEMPDRSLTVFSGKNSSARRYVSFRTDVRQSIVALVDAHLLASF